MCRDDENEEEDEQGDDGLYDELDEEEDEGDSDGDSDSDSENDNITSGNGSRIFVQKRREKTRPLQAVFRVLSIASQLGPTSTP